MKILWIIEDEIELSKDFKKEIESRFDDITVEQFYNMTDFLNKMKNEYTVPFLVFADIKLNPVDDQRTLIEKTGIKIVEQILNNEKLNNVPIILFTHLGITENDLLELDDKYGKELKRRYSKYFQLKSFNDITIKKISPEATARKLRILIHQIKNK